MYVDASWQTTDITTVIVPRIAYQILACSIGPRGVSCRTSLRLMEAIAARILFERACLLFQVYLCLG